MEVSRCDAEGAPTKTCSSRRLNFSSRWCLRWKEAARELVALIIGEKDADRFACDHRNQRFRRAVDKRVAHCKSIRDE